MGETVSSIMELKDAGVVGMLLGIIALEAYYHNKTKAKLIEQNNELMKTLFNVLGEAGSFAKQTEELKEIIKNTKR